MLVYMNCLPVLSLVLIAQSIFCLKNTREEKPTLVASEEWDYILFSQRWPITACTEWEETKQDNTCNLPTDKSQWTIHGIWPTKIGANGPQFCPSAVHFDPNQLQPIMDDLRSHWTNVEANTKPNSFWRHEWDKHGTCAITQPELNSIFNFFNQGLQWNKEFNLSSILQRGKILPGVNGYTVQQIYNAVKASTKKEPMIRCVVDKHTKESMVSEIRICFNRSMELIDCDHTNPLHNRLNDGMITNCATNKAVMYYDTVPINNEISYYEVNYINEGCKQYIDDQLYYIGLYKFLKFLIWFTT